ncbi:hypothetical protein ON010_g18647 [Phytophthora cinnamomi]|nr:hypothetical protein ON010_g18647 [Phytophthora cinnamomi]
MVVIQGPSPRIRRSPRLAKTPEDARMERTKVVEVVVQSKRPAARRSSQGQRRRRRDGPSSGTDGCPAADGLDDGEDRCEAGPAEHGGGQPRAASRTRGHRHVDSDGGAAAAAGEHDESAGSAGTRQAPPPAAPRNPPPAATDRQVVYQPRDRNDDGDDSNGDDDGSSSSSDDDESDGDRGDGGRRARRQPVTRQGDFRRIKWRTIRDLDLPTFLPTPQTAVTTWIARVDLALEGARLSGRGDWTDQELYYILGNKLQDSAARWWVHLDRKLRDRERTWTKLKSSLLRRYGERPDKPMAE